MFQKFKCSDGNYFTIIEENEQFTIVLKGESGYIHKKFDHAAFGTEVGAYKGCTVLFHQYEKELL